MASNDSPTEFRTALDIATPPAEVRRGSDSIRCCEVCSKIHDKQAWTGHEMQEDGSYRCLACIARQVPAKDYPLRGGQ